ncbi:MAG TPA: YceI family protein [Polyangiaceae bacterium]|nr:YceI family protein [Polyangiaceae bacterium]
MRAIAALFATLLVVSVAAADSAEWAVDASHSHVGFSVSHLVVSKVNGRFKEVSGKATIDEADPTKSQVDITIPVSSINTDDEKRDAHLKSPDFFDAAAFPNIVFHSTKIARGGKQFKITGDLTMHGVTKSVTLDGSLSKPIKSPWGKDVRGVEVKGKLNRSDYGLTWNKTLDGGGVVVGNEVTLDIAVEINK